MKNSDMPAMPTQMNGGDLYGGLTKREHFAGLAWAALLSATHKNGDWSGIDAGAAEQAIKETDIFLAELDKDNQL